MSERPESARVKARAGSSSESIAADKESPTVVRPPSGSNPRHSVGPTSSGSGVYFSEALPLPVPGQLIDCFELEEVIGVGGMGAVFRARDTKLDREVALKLIPQEQSDDPEVVKRFYQEGRSAARLDHENIARVYTIGRDGPYHFIAFEYIEGETLRRRVETNGPLRPVDAINFTLQIAAALVHASERGVVHRDIKPSNIIITPKGRAKLVDMGLARQFESEEDHGLTQSGMTLGTFDYISPEQARDPRDVDVRSDLYSLGCTMFHMLTGRPPFHGGTVLQKLLQHQEEVAPDARDFNPDVPSELAAVMAKLMAKDRERRYQTPEQLVRDLLVLGGSGEFDLGDSYGLLRPSYEHASFPPWAGHLVWAVPFLAFAVVIGGLVWWGRELNGPAQGTVTAPGFISSRSAQRGAPSAVASLPERRADEDGPASEVRARPAGQPRTITVGSNEDLFAKLQSSPPRSIITLSDEGPYLIGDRDNPRNTPFRLRNRDITIRAEAGIRPVVTTSPGSLQGDVSPAGILEFAGGRIAIEGIEFVVDANASQAPSSAISADGTELSLRRCTFRVTGDSGDRTVTSLRIKAAEPATPSTDRNAAVSAVESYFGGSHAAIVAEGPVDLDLRECSVGSDGIPLRIDNSRGRPGDPARIHLGNASFMAGEGPIFQVKGQARFWADYCVMAPAARGSTTTLISADNPRELVWRGRSNKYSRIGTFLEPSSPDAEQRPIKEFSRWAKTETEIREVGSQFQLDGIWKHADPLQAIARALEHPSQSFLLSAANAEPNENDMVAGARQGPLGTMARDLPSEFLASLDPDKKVATTAPSTPTPAETPSSRPTEVRDDEKKLVANDSQPRDGGTSTFLQPRPMPVAHLPEEDATADGDSVPGTSTSTIPPMPPMTTTPEIAKQEASGKSQAAELAVRQPRVDGRISAGIPADNTGASTNVPAKQPDRQLAVRTENRTPAASPREVRTTDEFRGALAALGERGGTIQIAAGALLELPSTVIGGEGTWRFEGSDRSSTGRRPRIRFVPYQNGLNGTALQWSVLFALKSGRFEFQNLDIVIPSLENLLDDRVAAFGLGGGAELRLTDCSLTLVGSHENLAAIVTLPGGPQARPKAADRPDARYPKIEARDSFIRSGGDFVVVPRPLRGGVEVSLANVLLAADGSAVHARGGPAHGALDRPDEQDGPIRFNLDRTTTRTKRSLIRLESSNDDPELPRAQVVARDSIFCLTNPEESLVSVVGHDQVVDSLRDKLTWKGTRLTYYQVTNFRRDQKRETGSPPRNYNRQYWANTATDSDPVYEQFHFDKWSPSLSAWLLKVEDLRPSPDSLKSRGNVGPDLRLIPVPPSAE